MSLGTLDEVSGTISFLSDFGHRDEFVGVVHGVIARVAPDVRVIDITHGIDRGHVHAGAMALTRAVQFMPDGVFLAVVDPGVGGDRLAIAVRTPVGFFVGPDNGLLAPAIAMVGGADLAVSLEAEQFQLPSAGSTFHGRDIFAPAAAVLASGEAAITDLGPAVDLDAMTPLLLPLAEPAGNARVKAAVLWVDGFGNVQFNIAGEDLAALGLAPGDDVLVGIDVAEHRIEWGVSYGSVEEGEAVIHIDSSGQVALAVRGGSASDDFDIGTGDTVLVGRPDGGNRIEIRAVP
ncbi:MAG: SAM-dependent chlorinase/fluorinase [Acidimicrobiia bacterium]|nr:SAM-dependent chlorinase/fluorinase [Acidimicrobiia bacterium]